MGACVCMCTRACLCVFSAAFCQILSTSKEMMQLFRSTRLNTQQMWTLDMQSQLEVREGSVSTVGGDWSRTIHSTVNERSRQFFAMSLAWLSFMMCVCVWVQMNNGRELRRGWCTAWRATALYSSASLDHFKPRSSGSYRKEERDTRWVRSWACDEHDAKEWINISRQTAMKRYKALEKERYCTFTGQLLLWRKFDLEPRFLLLR